MIKQPRIPLLDLILCLSHIIDLISSDLSNHHKRVAYTSYYIAEAYGLPQSERNRILLAGLLHDCGALSLKEKLAVADFEFAYSSTDRHRHGKIGARFFDNVKLLSHIAPLIRSHHIYWNERDDPTIKDGVQIGCHILHLADRVDVLLLDNQQDILLHNKTILGKIKKESGRMFSPELVRIFEQLAQQECFWLDMVSPFIDNILSRKADLRIIDLDLEGLEEVAKLFYQIIDFRSPFTATHSVGVASCAIAISKLFGFSETERRMMGIAGYLHDLGKLAIPAEILEKPGRLTNDEMTLMKRHTYYSYRILEPINGLETISQWAFFHHERLDRSGYPFHLGFDDLSLGSRILAVADIFAALTEERPYRKPMTREDTISILRQDAEANRIDTAIVSMAERNFEQIYNQMSIAQKAATHDYNDFSIAESPDILSPS